MNQKISPCLWFDNNAEEAVSFYTSAFGLATVGNSVKYDEASAEVSGQKEGSTMLVPFEIEGYKFLALNGGPAFKITPAISFTVNRESKEEVDKLWEKLSIGGQALMPLDSYFFSERYGWIQDKFGVSWQITFNKENPSREILPSLMFTREVAGRAEEAMKLYTSIFKNSKIGEIHRYGPGKEPEKEDSIMYADFTLEGQKFSAMDSATSHQFTFSEGVSLIVDCESQEEVDYLWDKLGEGGDPKAQQCGWLKDRFGVSWQIVPVAMNKMLGDPDKEKAQKVMKAMLEMKKIDLNELQRVYES